jgi:hypothetical protein
MDHVRVGKDVLTFEREGVVWVTAHSGGVSTFARPGVGLHWWRIPRGCAYSEALLVHNDHGDHYLWEPRVDMPLMAYVMLLAMVHAHCIKVC